MKHFLKPKEFASGDFVETTELDRDTQSTTTDSDSDKSTKFTDEEWEMAFNFFVF